jgi:hypothetical protein
MRSEADDAWINICYLAQDANAFRILDDTRVTNTSGVFTGLLGDQTQATWETGTGTTESLVSPAKIKAAIEALGINPSDLAYGTEFVQVITPTTTTAIDIALPSTSSFGSVTIELQNVGMTSSTSQLLEIQTSSDGGSTFASASNSYNTNGTDGSTIEITNDTKNNSNKGISGEVKIYGYDISASWTAIHSNLSFEDSSTSGDIVFKSTHGWRKANEITTHVRLKFSSGSNFRSGQGRIIVRGHRKN